MKVKSKILRVLKEAKEPLSIDAVRFRAKLKGWGTARFHLLELLLVGKIEGTKTSRGWIFWDSNEQFLSKEDRIVR